MFQSPHMLGFGADKSTLLVERKKEEKCQKEKKKKKNVWKIQSRPLVEKHGPLIEAERVASKKRRRHLQPTSSTDRLPAPPVRSRGRPFRRPVRPYHPLCAHAPPTSRGWSCCVCDPIARSVPGTATSDSESSSRNALVDQRIVCAHQARVACVEVSSKARRQCTSDHGHVFIATHCKAHGA